ncbi:MAG TPA: HRDC domain-containing protein [Anaerolineales bacterium]|nr:HRDC domain-containing protein [Anaerolineales bacterium]
MNVNDLPEPVLIIQPQALEKLAAELMQHPIVAVDTESNSLYVFQEQVCLIQFSTPERDYLVDPLALDDLSPLEPVFASPQVEKVFHAAEYDIICLKRDFGFEFANLFDTMVAARILGREAVGLGSMLDESFGVHLEKRYQRANWGERPLPEHLLRYARLDTHFLIGLRDRLEAELREQKLLPLANEDFDRLTQVNGVVREAADPEQDCWRVKGSHDLQPREAAVLIELCRYRTMVAERINRPLFKVMHDSTLVAIAELQPTTLADLGRLPGMSQRQVERHGRAILAAVQRGRASDPAYPPHSPRPDDAYLERVERLRQWRKQAARAMGVKSDVVLPRDLMLELASRNPHDRQQLAHVLRSARWRLEHFGSDILQALAGH